MVRMHHYSSRWRLIFHLLFCIRSPFNLLHNCTMPHHLMNHKQEVNGFQAYAAEAANVNGTSIENLKLEYRTNPIGVDTNPRFSWNMVSDVRGQKQTAYQILVATSEDKLNPTDADVWNSGKVMSDKSVAIEYAGAPLSPTTRYYWTVKVWDKDGNELATPEANYFETGVLSTDGIAGWDGAKWISIDTTDEADLRHDLQRSHQSRVEWATAEAATAYQAVLITGKPNRLFDPYAGATRAEAVTVILRLLELLEA